MKVMIIEDEPVIRQALAMMVKNLEIEQFKVSLLTEVEYAEHAQSYLEKEDYDFVFVDIKGGELSGLDLIKDWHKRKHRTEWIIVSGYDRFDYAQRAIIYEVQEYLLKPVTKAKLTTSVERCLRQMDERNHDFISADFIETFIMELKHSIWTLNKEQLKQQVMQWERETSAKRISPRQYNDIINHIVSSLVTRLTNKEMVFSDDEMPMIECKNFSKANQMLLNKSMQMIKKIQNMRKGDELDPIVMAKQYILEQIDENISLEDVARKIGFNSSYFSQVFKRKTGQTFVQYRTHLRMERAKEILMQRDVRIIDIPFLIGLNDHPHFTKIFKKHTGYTPSGYRRKMGIV